jgi:hypothetical protein
MKTSKKQFGIEVNQVCYKIPKIVKGKVYYKSVTEAELNKFLDAFIDLVESKGMCCGGGMKRIDVNKYPEESIKEPWEIKVAMKQCSKAMKKGDPKLCPLWPKDSSLYCHDCTACYAWRWVLGEKI